MTININDKITLPCLSADLAGRQSVQGTERMTFAAMFSAADVAFTDVLAVYNDTTALALITVTDGDSTVIRRDFDIPVELAIKDGVIKLTVAERTTAEKEQAELKKLMVALLAAQKG